MRNLVPIELPEWSPMSASVNVHWSSLSRQSETVTEVCFVHKAKKTGMVLNHRRCLRCEILKPKNQLVLRRMLDEKPI